ncbi:hypothetical protein AN403_6105 [Pseudomonas fluorescens]|uniref:Uncharacterized protein n=1 Tax=Pseudomonas fluorescens TaxID=294 RepID=A0A0P8X7C4_PSEFL|nr:hypothetical protein AN403_6105 [Pseudomonas fluorescens]
MPRLTLDGCEPGQMWERACSRKRPDRQHLSHTPRQFKYQENHQQRTRTMGKGISLPSREQESGHGVITSENLLRITNPQHCPHADNRPQQIRHQHVHRFERRQLTG